MLLILLPDVYFKVAISDGQEFPTNSTILWGTVLENVGGGYNASTGMFVAPLGGSYHFTATVMSTEPQDRAYLTLKVKGMELCSALARGFRLETGVCSHVMRLAAGEEVWVIISSNYHQNLCSQRPNL